MALTVAELQVQLEGQTKKFDRSLRASETRLKSFERTGNRATKSVGTGLTRIGSVAGPAIAALGVTVLATRLISAAKNVTAFTDAIGKQADAVGTTTAFLQEFRVAVTLTGGTIGGADKALTKLNRNIAEAAEGTGPAADAFQQLGIPLEEIQGLPLPDVIGRIADELTNVTTPAEKTAIAIDLFGRSGDKLVNTLAEGSDGLRAFQQRARDTGQVIDESLIRRAELINDRFQLANDRLRNATIPILTDLREGMTIFSEAAVVALNAITGLSEQRPITEASIAGVSMLTREIVALEEEIRKVEALETGTFTDPAQIALLRRERQELQGRRLDLLSELQGVQRLRAEQQGLALAIQNVGEAASEAAMVSRFEFFTEEQAAAEAGRLRDTFLMQQELATIREEAIGDELRAIDAAKAAEAEKDRVALEAIAEKTRKETELRDLRLAASMSLLELEQMLLREQATGGDPLRERLLDIQDQIAMAAQQREAVPEDVGAQIAGATAIGILQQQRRDLTQEINDLEMANATVADAILERSQQIARTDLDRAESLQEQLNILLAQGLPLEELQRRLQDILMGVTPMEGEMEETTADRLAAGITSSVFGALTGGLDDFGGSLLDTVIDATSDGTKAGFEEAQKFITDSLSKGISGAAGALGGLFDDGGDGGGGGLFGSLSNFIGSEKGQGFINSAVGLGARAIQGFRSGAEQESVAGGVVSAVTSVQRVRGLVTGPTQVAVAQVDRGIRDAFLPTERLLDLIEQNTRATATQTSDTGTGSVPTGGTSEATQALANEGPSIV